METESLARFKKISANQMVGPGKCAGCGKFSNDDFLDFGLELDFYGVVYFCRDCLVEAGIVFGLRPDDHYKKIEGDLEVSRRLLSQAALREEAMLNALASIDPSALRTHFDSVSGSSVEIDERPGNSSVSTDAGEQGSNEPRNEQGSTGLQRDDSIDALLGASGLDI